MRLRSEVLADEERTLWKAVREMKRAGAKRRQGESGLGLVDRLEGALDRLEELLPAG